MCLSSIVCSWGKRLSTGSLTSTSWSKDTDLQREELSCQLGLEPVKDVWKSTWCWEGTCFYWAGWQRRDILEKGHISYIITPWGCVRKVCINLPRIDARIYIFFSHTQANTIQWKKCWVSLFILFFSLSFFVLCVSVCIYRSIWHSQAASSTAQLKRWLVHWSTVCLVLTHIHTHAHTLTIQPLRPQRYTFLKGNFVKTNQEWKMIIQWSQ